MARPKRNRDWGPLIDRVKELWGEHPDLTVEEMARRVGVRKSLLSFQLKANNLATPGQLASENRIFRRIEETPVKDIVGIHVQRAVCGDLRKYSRVVVVATAIRSMPQTNSMRKLEKSEPIVFAPSVISMDVCRASKFERKFFSLIEVLDNPRDPKIDKSRLEEAIWDFVEFGQEDGYGVEIAVNLEGVENDGLRKRIASVPGCRIFFGPIEEMIVRNWWDPVVSKLGVGRFPLLDRTVQRLDEELRRIKVEPSGILHLAWSPNDIQKAMTARLHVCDRLCSAGLLYGAPLNKAAEMAAEAQSSFSRSLTNRPEFYGDGLDSSDKKRRGGFVRLGVPTRLRSRYLCRLPLDLSGCRDLMDFRQVDIDGKIVDCLVAWLPSLRQMVLDAMRRPGINNLLVQWLAVQRRAVAELKNDAFRCCSEILDRQGTINLRLWWYGLAHSKDPMIENLALGFLLAAYDADSIIGALICSADRQKCLEFQNEWTSRVTEAAEQAMPTILGCARWEDSVEARWQLNSDLAAAHQRGHRLIRFILEEAAQHCGRAFRRAAQRLGVDVSYGWPNEDLLVGEALSILDEETREMWPVVGVRMDYLVTRQAGLLRRHLSEERTTRCCEGLVSYNEGYAPHNVFTDEESYEDGLFFDGEDGEGEFDRDTR